MEKISHLGGIRAGASIDGIFGQWQSDTYKDFPNFVYFKRMLKTLIFVEVTPILKVYLNSESRITYSLEFSIDSTTM